MHQRWLGTVLLNCEAGFRTVKGYSQIESVVEEISKLHGQDGPALTIAI